MHFQPFFILDLLGDSPTARRSVADSSWHGLFRNVFTATAQHEIARRAMSGSACKTKDFLKEDGEIYSLFFAPPCCHKN